MPFTVPLSCPKCGGSVEVQTLHTTDERLVESIWQCPYCRASNRLSAPWRVIWVSRPGQSEASH